MATLDNLNHAQLLAVQRAAVVGAYVPSFVLSELLAYHHALSDVPQSIFKKIAIPQEHDRDPAVSLPLVVVFVGIERHEKRKLPAPLSMCPSH